MLPISLCTLGIVIAIQCELSYNKQMVLIFNMTTWMSRGALVRDAVCGCLTAWRTYSTNCQPLDGFYSSPGRTSGEGEWLIKVVMSLYMNAKSTVEDTSVRSSGSFDPKAIKIQQRNWFNKSLTDKHNSLRLRWRFKLKPYLVIKVLIIPPSYTQYVGISCYCQWQCTFVTSHWKVGRNSGIFEVVGSNMLVRSEMSSISLNHYRDEKLLVFSLWAIH